VRAICDDHGTLLYYEGTAENINKDVKARKSVKLSTLFLKTLGIFSASELLVMFILASLNLSTGIWGNLLDSLLLTILGAPFFYFWVLKGLTRHLVREAAVAQTEAETQEYRYHTLIDTAPDIIYTRTAGDGMISMLNPAFETITGWPRDEWIGKTFADLVHPDDLQFATDTFEQILKGKNPPPYELRILTKSGTYIIGEFTIVPLFELGKIVGVLGIARDITERKRAEEGLIIANKELAASNTELEQFAYVASHDLQEPLRMVSSFLNLLEKRMEGQLDDTSRQYIDFAVDGAMRMKSLIMALLEYSRVGTNKEDFAPVDLNEVVQYVINVLEENIKKNTALVTLKPLPVITANKTLITHLFLNLVNNALKYHNGNQTEIEIGSTEDEDWYFIYVRDNGIGIDPKFFDKIFVIFQRLHNKSEYSGTGIGLAICKKIVEIHKGTIWVESEPGKGSTFYFSIPKQNA